MPEAEIFPGLDVAVYELIVVPPLSAGAVKPTNAAALLPVTLEIVGASGTLNPFGHNEFALYNTASVKLQKPLAEPVYLVLLVVGPWADINLPLYLPITPCPHN